MAELLRFRFDKLTFYTSDQCSEVRRAGRRGRHSWFDMAEFLRYHFDDARRLDGKGLGSGFARLRSLGVLRSSSLSSSEVLSPSSRSRPVSSAGSQPM
ncbi:uncharacterized protein ACA1_068010 [Acanthamoeba castellanii str. Neff]|uniref:Uncharacterized protein n=1 Tax=Acanthamoeba castellanii (strain ATCC 30010 / Neff) TaxID=1257118 RepID=L8HDA8_ACACF|nr:uncharacterized protein ACA1_068010 [Acanthamoeba castellanii str. Neff]ELR23217.1 hypothetical protein ACA1_068010 [Acanthamoeba castellanii str. Neff]